MTKETEFLARLLEQRQQATNAIFWFFKDGELIFVSRKMNCEHPCDSFTVTHHSGDIWDIEKKFVEMYQPRFNVQKTTFNAFNYYKEHIALSISPIQTKAIISWMQQLPSELLQYAMEQVVEKCPSEPFGYLKKIIETWIENEVRTLDEAKAAEGKRVQQYSKGADRHAEHERSIAENGHYQGIPSMDF